MSKETGGAAFPYTAESLTCGADRTGMTLRDYFAAKIAAGILAGGWANTVPLDDIDHARQLAAFAYTGADFMLAERSKP